MDSQASECLIIKHRPTQFENLVGQWIGRKMAVPTIPRAFVAAPSVRDNQLALVNRQDLDTHESPNIAPLHVPFSWTPIIDPCDREEYREAQEELDQIKAAAGEEGCPEPTDELVQEAGNLLRWMFRKLPFAYDVSPEDDGGIAIHAIHDKVYVCVMLSQEGPYRCFVNLDGERRRSTYTDRRKVYGTFLKGALQDLCRYGG